jgi:hypothetical protein
MQRERLLTRVALSTILVLSLAGCASGSKPRLDMAKSCQAHGGTWSQSQETCTMSTAGAGGEAKRAREICAAQGGDYLPGGTCMLEGTK